MSYFENYHSNQESQIEQNFRRSPLLSNPALRRSTFTGLSPSLVYNWDLISVLVFNFLNFIHLSSLAYLSTRPAHTAFAE